MSLGFYPPVYPGFGLSSPEPEPYYRRKKKLVPFKRSFPFDLLHLIFPASSQHTLTVLARVSLNFLSMAAPILYKVVTLEQPNLLAKLFCFRGHIDRFESKINAFLSLDQIRHLNIDFSNSLIFPNLATPGFDRLAGPKLTLDRLSDPRRPRSPYASKPGRSHLPNTSTQLDSTSPSSPGKDDDPPPPNGFFSKVPYSLRWSRIEIVNLKGLIPYSWNNESMRIAALPSPTPLQTLRLHLDTFFSRRHHPDSATLVRAFAEDDHYFGFKERRVGAVFLVVNEEEERNEVEEVVKGLGKRWRELLVVELEVW